MLVVVAELSNKALQRLRCSCYSQTPTVQGGNFHLKVGGAKSSGNAGDPMLGVAVSGGSKIYKRGGIK